MGFRQIFQCESFLLYGKSKAYFVIAGSSSTSASVVQQIYDLLLSSSDSYSDTEIPSSVSGSVSSLASSWSALPTKVLVQS